MTVELSDGVCEIGRGAFKGCNKLENINIPESVSTIGAFAFDGCGCLKNILIPGGVTVLNEGTFRDCVNLGSITLSSGLQIIYSNVFNKCSSLQSISIPDTVVTMRDKFIGCNSLAEINVAATNTAYKSISGILYDIDMTTLIKCPPAKEISSFSVPDGIKILGTEAFADCNRLTTVFFAG